ncbi:MAG: hypothetical protein JWQ71_3730 [Pedosphaera sp.]|nr:hypothetical protein [Pedosphaera sp.]
MDKKTTKKFEQIRGGYLAVFEGVSSGRIKLKDAAKASKPFDAKLAALKKTLKRSK